MKETIKVGIGGYAFICDVDAYEALDNYLNNLKSYFENKSDGTEVINDIESRMSELLSLKGKTPGYIITLADAQDIIGIMGKPSDIAEEDVSDNEKKSFPQTSKKEFPSTGKKLYRDADNAILGGVFSGLGHYFRIDPVILRIIYLALFFFFTFTWNPLHKFAATLFIAYFILWIVVPKARTFQQKLAMSGKDSSVDTIASGNVNGGVRGSSIGRVLGGIFKVLVAIILFSIAAACIFSALTVLFLPSVAGQPSIKDILETVGISDTYFLPSIFIICFIPVFMIIYAIIRIMKRFLLRDVVVLGIAFALWLGACFYCTTIGVRFSKDFKHKSSVVEKIIPQVQSDTLNIQLGSAYRASEALFDSDEVFQLDNDDKKTWFIVPHINIERDVKYKNIEIEIHKKAFGKSRQIAEDKANSSTLGIVEQGSDIIINPHLYNRDNVWDREIFSITIYCPEDKTILVDELLDSRTGGERQPEINKGREENDSEQKGVDNQEEKLKKDSAETVSLNKEI